MISHIEPKISIVCNIDERDSLISTIDAAFHMLSTIDDTDICNVRISEDNIRFIRNLQLQLINDRDSIFPEIYYLTSVEWHSLINFLRLVFGDIAIEMPWTLVNVLNML